MLDTYDIDEALTDKPCYATADEIALAERLRRKIEERYLNENDRGESPRSLLKAA